MVQAMAHEINLDLYHPTDHGIVFCCGSACGHNHETIAATIGVITSNLTTMAYLLLHNTSFAIPHYQKHIYRSHQVFCEITPLQTITLHDFVVDRGRSDKVFERDVNGVLY